MNFARKSYRATKQFFKANALDPFPAGQALRNYSLKQVPYDTKAALNVALLALPQGMAYAAIAELPIYYGIICSIIAAFIAPLFASSQYTILGPTNATAFMIFSFFNAQPDVSMGEKIMMMPLLVFMVGAFSIIGAYLKLADLIQYVSRSVLVGYLTGAAILIMTGQFKHILGINQELQAALMSSEAPKTFFLIVSKITQLWQNYQWQPILLGGLTLLAYLFIQKKYRTLPAFALTLTISTLLALVLRSNFPVFAHLETFTAFDASAISFSLPSFKLSSFSLLVGVAFAITFLASLENTIMSKNLASQTGTRSEVNQDMLSLGFANIASSLLCPMPASGSLTRSALNFASGAMSRFSSIISSLFCLLGLILLLSFPIVENIPKACLAGLVVGIALSLINRNNIRICLKSTSGDALVVIVTFLATLLTRLDYAIFIGVALSITLFLRKASRPQLIEYDLNEEGSLHELDQKSKRSNPAISIVHVEGNLFFGAADLFRTQVQHTASDPNLKVIILRLKNARHLDATSVMAMEELIKFMRDSGRQVLVSGATRDVYKVLKSSGALQIIQEGCDRTQGETNIFICSPSNPNLSTRDALLRAQSFIGSQEADIKIYYDPLHNQETE